jgi:hypothetical protein
MPTVMLVMTNILQSCLKSFFPSDYWDTLLIQLYWKSTNTNNSTSRLTPAISIKNTLCNSRVETSLLVLVALRPRYVFLQSKTLRVYSLFVILLSVITLSEAQLLLLSRWVNLPLVTL